MLELMRKLSQAVISGDLEGAAGLAEQLLGDGAAPQDIIDNGLMPGMEYVGAQFRKGEMFIPEVLLSARAMQKAMDVVKPHLVSGNLPSQGTVVIGTVQGDLHDIGKNLVRMMLEAAGFTVVDLGIDVPADRFLEAVKIHRPQVLGLSALLTTTMRNMAAVIDTLREAGIRQAVKIMVGGAPVTSDFARTIGADGYAPNAVAAVDLARSLATS
ncbi:MAG: corrinoid protein [Bacillota bacterium]|nr:corrinoid protein [Bacillota bacterium]